MDAATLTMIVTLANGEVTTTTRDFATMKGCEALAAAFLATENGTGRTVATKCEKAASGVDQPAHK
jgi:hypothetical protein